MEGIIPLVHVVKVIRIHHLTIPITLVPANSIRLVPSHPVVTQDTIVHVTIGYYHHT